MSRCTYQRHRHGLCTSQSMNGTLQYLIQETKMGLRGCGSCYGLRESLPEQRSGCGSKAARQDSFFQAKLMAGHARQHSVALPKILFVTVCGTRAQGRSLLKLTHLHRQPQICLRARRASYMHLCAHALVDTAKKKERNRKHTSTANITQGQCTTCGPMQK